MENSLCPWLVMGMVGIVIALCVGARSRAMDAVARYCHHIEVMDKNGMLTPMDIAELRMAEERRSELHDAAMKALRQAGENVGDRYEGEVVAWQLYRGRRKLGRKH